MIELPWKLVWIILVCLVLVIRSTTDSPETSPTTTTKSNDVTHQIIEQSLLKMFGFKKRPRLKKGTVIPDYLLKLYEEKVKDQSESTDFAHSRRLLTGPANTVRSFYHIDTDDDSDSDSSSVRLRFNVDDMPMNEILAGAELRLYKEWLTDAEPSLYRVDIHDIIKLGKTSDDTISHLVDTKFIDTRKTDDWESFDISATVLRWLKSRRTENIVEVRFVKKGGRDNNEHVRVKRSAPDDVESKKRKKKRRKKNRNSDDDGRKRPHLVTYSDDGNAQTKAERREERRRNREARRRRRRKWKDQCRRHKLYVDFNDVGWTDWIVAPPGYHAFYCHGECPMPLADHLNSTNHAIVQNLVNSAYPEAVPKACCVPTELSPISMLYADETGAVVLKTYQEMVVQGCGCR